MKESTDNITKLLEAIKLLQLQVSALDAKVETLKAALYAGYKEGGTKVNIWQVYVKGDNNAISTGYGCKASAAIPETIAKPAKL